MLPPATASHHHCLLSGLEVSVTHTLKEILQGVSINYDDAIHTSRILNNIQVITLFSWV